MFNSDHIIKTSIEAIRLGIPSQFANHFVGQTAGYCVTQTCESCGKTMQIHNDARLIILSAGDTAILMLSIVCK